MATQREISVRAGRTYTITTTVSGVTDWSDKSAVMVVSKSKDKDAILTIAGGIDSGNDVVSFDLASTDTESLVGIYYYEMTVYTDDRSFVKDVNYGKFIVNNTIDTDPTD